jgi:alpha-D-ribose 1-methylphosphonate 5-triphosphate synthase subunit PhnG
LSEDLQARKRWMGVLAKASADAIRACLHTVPPLPPHTRLRGPETGLVMLRGRAGGDGAAFNLSEMTVTRCAVTLEGTETVGHAYVAGRDRAQAELAAVIEPLAAAQAEARATEARKAAATRVQFFTMANMR